MKDQGVMSKNALRSLDLFSGCGGITHAFRGLADPVLYCERESTRIDALKTLVSKGLLPKAPIHNDVQTLRKEHLEDVDIIVGGWPCFVAGTLVLTDEGYKPIETVRGTEKLLTHTGSWRPIRSLQRKLYPGTLCSVKTQGGLTPIQCTDTHPFYVRTATNSIPDWVPARNLTKEHFVGLPIDKTSTILPGREWCLHDDQWYLMGYYVRVGWIHQGKTATYLPAFGEIAVQLENTLNAHQQAAWCDMLAEFGTSSVLPKRIPEWVHTAPTHLLKAFLKGYKSASILRTIIPASSAAASDDAHVLLGLERIRAKLGRQRRGCLVENGYMWYPVLSVTTTDLEKPVWVYNFEVAEDHSYVVENRIVKNCRGFSSIGSRNGFEHPQSALFVHLARLVEECRPPLVFQENVPGVTGDGLSDITRAMDVAGYDIWWCVIPAYTVGAPQVRNRWYSLAVRRDIKDMQIQLSEPYTQHDWTAHKDCPRMTLQKQPLARLSMMGNSVCPDAVRLAFLFLFTGMQNMPEELWAMKTLHLKRPESTGLAMPPVGGKRRVGSFIKGHLELQVLPEGFIPPKPNLNLRVEPTAYISPKTCKADPAKWLTEGKDLELWGTPRGGCLGASNGLTQRDYRDLYTAVRFETNTPDELRGGHPNPDWVEACVMGFPEGWTEMHGA